MFLSLSKLVSAKNFQRALKKQKRIRRTQFFTLRISKALKRVPTALDNVTISWNIKRNCHQHLVSAVEASWYRAWM